MKVLLILAVLGVPLFGIACVICACMSAIGWAFFSAMAVVFCLFVASREFDGVREDRIWTDSKRHPRV